jgi:cysteate synthase
MYAVSNEEGRAAAKLLRDTEGIDPDPAAAVATAALVQAVETGAIGQDDLVLLNITGGGYDRIQEDYTLYPLEASATATPGEPCDRLVADLKTWVAHYG